MHSSFNDTFLSDKDLSKYVSNDKIINLKNLANIAKEAKLSSKHLYKDFNGVNAVGNISLLQNPIVAIVGTRYPNQYSRYYTASISKELSRIGFSIISGGAIGIDCIAHSNSMEKSIMVLPCGININYPKENTNLINNIRQNALVLSEYKPDCMPYKHSFLERNRIIIALSDIVIIPQADLKSGSISSANLTNALQKPLFVLPHRINESLGTQDLLNKNRANCIYDIKSFIESLCKIYHLDSIIESKDEIIEFAMSGGLFQEALNKFGDKVLEYELEGKIKRNGIYICTGD